MVDRSGKKLFFAYLTSGPIACILSLIELFVCRYFDCERREMSELKFKKGYAPKPEELVAAQEAGSKYRKDFHKDLDGLFIGGVMKAFMSKEALPVWGIMFMKAMGALDIGVVHAMGEVDKVQASGDNDDLFPKTPFNWGKCQDGGALPQDLFDPHAHSGETGYISQFDMMWVGIHPAWQQYANINVSGYYEGGDGTGCFYPVGGVE